MESEFNLLLEDYLAVEKYAFDSGTHEGYEAVKKNARFSYLVLSFFLVSLFVYLNSLVVIPAIILLVYCYRKFSAKLTWLQLRKGIEKNVLMFQFNGDYDGMNACKMEITDLDVIFWTNREKQLFSIDRLIAVEGTETYIFLLDDRGRGICAPFKRLDRASQDYVSEWVKQWQNRKI